MSEITRRKERLLFLMCLVGAPALMRDRSCLRCLSCALKWRDGSWPHVQGGHSAGLANAAARVTFTDSQSSEDPAAESPVTARAFPAPPDGYPGVWTSTVLGLRAFVCLFLFHRMIVFRKARCLI